MKIHQAHHLYIAFIVYEGSVAMIEQLWLTDTMKLRWIQRDEYQAIRLSALPFKYHGDYLGCYKSQAFHKIKLFGRDVEQGDNCDKN